LSIFGKSNNLTKLKMSKEIIFKFANEINEHRIEAIYSLMTDDHMFIDAHGNEVVGKDKMKAAWTGYFQWFPDYKIEITDIFENGEAFGAFGYASGSFQGKKTGSIENYWRLPASWRVVVSNNKIKLWQVYADTKIPFDIIGRNR
jgi:ketosteroid isomerase-like protein